MNVGSTVKILDSNDSPLPVGTIVKIIANDDPERDIPVWEVEGGWVFQENMLEEVGNSLSMKANFQGFDGSNVELEIGEGAGVGHDHLIIRINGVARAYAHISANKIRFFHADSTMGEFSTDDYEVRGFDD